jgi:hypothetical protein
LRHILDVLRDEIRAGTPVVMLEPSCCATFRDELTNLLPHDLDARRLKEQTFLLSEILEKKGYEPLQLDRKALVHFHCHHGAIMKKDCEMALLRKLGLDFHVLDSGCCGMAGAFGFEKGEHYEVSIQCGERVLLPAVRQADRHTLIVTDGFSCHEQIRQQTGREALHLAQVLELAMREGRRKPRLPESAPRHTDAMPSSPKRGWFAVGAVAAGILAAKLLLGTRNSRFGRGAILTRRNTDGKLKRSRKARKETRHVSPARGG